eukprot:CAMPEP_0170488038 /NCGR_PEP_ID=MMETSP0208-20121228/6676_1 /TAXON_ID=197538 /ORGANISM="Strombidium inclinatum, Strain S3" /LENGTH=140 /DNA_ID=CAMNT_0010762471 /DNA_START=1082 /DNA_END=1504 /DNA_ORIENTATION=+
MEDLFLLLEAAAEEALQLLKETPSTGHVLIRFAGLLFRLSQVSLLPHVDDVLRALLAFFNIVLEAVLPQFLQSWDYHVVVVEGQRKDLLGQLGRHAEVVETLELHLLAEDLFDDDFPLHHELQNQDFVLAAVFEVREEGA